MKTTGKLYLLALIASLSFLHTAHGMNLFGDKKSAAALAVGQSKIIVTTQLRLLEIDGEKHSLNLLNSGDTVVDVAPGYHDFTVRYDKVWDIDYDNFDILKSSPVTISIAAESGKSYRITHHELESYKEAKAFSKKPEIFVVDVDNGTNVVAEKKEQFALTTTSADVSKPSNAAAPAAAIATTSGMPSSAARLSALPMLQYWWERASMEEKQRFYDWIQAPRL